MKRDPEPRSTPPRSLVDRLDTLLQRRFLDRLVASPNGRAFLLGFMADAEESDEQAVFDTLLARVDDDALRKMVRIHRDDEERHGKLLRECVARGGVTPLPVPPHLRVVFCIDRELGGFAERFVAGEHGVMEAYVLLQVIEERAVIKFPNIVRALRRVDPDSADVVDRVLRDEQRHVGYAMAISRRYASSPELLQRTVAAYRAAEARAYAVHANAMLRFALEHDLLAIGPAERLMWRALAALPARVEQDRLSGLAASHA